ncbi:MAG: hypothetical protein ACLGI3_08905, partial [Actinomycetes bacterium]
SGGAPNAYIVDRGVDNDDDPGTFNDGRLHEVAIPGLTGPARRWERRGAAAPVRAPAAPVQPAR